ncbi:hypothetical protein DNU06_08205 [Putridiphycobacter roseus]|uniref:Uncharacterized protein n=1 Tax=Putridiphycobacter roseus TaxID=2219161 RepID=A0A2W1NGX7_9FLAO|nr:hypothetical protein [Putridiphycobacter roseus]PZE17246.1 hypothetical protein DNU06_08205 [Putridiphycobacter roseus]
MNFKTVVLGAIGLLLISCGGAGNGPEKATEMYVKAIAEGAYEKALDLSTGSAAETIKQMQETEAAGYETKIVEVQCETDNETETAKCKCTERKSDSLAFLKYKYDSFQYELEKVDGKWKVISQSKDMVMPDLGDMGGFGDEDMMEDMPMEESIMTEEIIEVEEN